MRLDPPPNMNARTPGGLLLPAGLRERRPEQTREQGRRRDNPNGTRVDQAAVWMGRQGWRHEVSAEWVDRRDGSTVRDVLWLDVAHQADALAAAAADRLASTGGPVQLSALARELAAGPARADAAA